MIKEWLKGKGNKKGGGKMKGNEMLASRHHCDHTATGTKSKGETANAEAPPPPLYSAVAHVQPIRFTVTGSSLAA